MRRTNYQTEASGAKRCDERDRYGVEPLQSGSEVWITTHSAVF